MPDRPLFLSVCLLLVLLVAVPVYGQKQPPAMPGAGDEGQVVQPAQPEPPKQVLNIDVQDGHLSVELTNVAFGTAIRAVADRAGFKIEGSGEVFSRKLNTKFLNLEIERGVTRLLSLVNESNYMLHYNAGGSISKLEIFPTAAGGPASPGMKQPPRPQIPPRQQPIPQPLQQPQPSAVAPPSVPPGQMPLPVQQPQPATVSPPSIPRVPPPSRPLAPPPRPVQPQMFPDEEFSEENVEAIPYVAPQPRQPLIPPRR